MNVVKVLDKGWVALKDSLPVYSEIEAGYSSLDNAIVTAARTSFSGVSKGAEADKRLLMRLWRDEHTSPFEMVTFKFLVRAPLVVFWQWVRHRTFSYQSVNSESGRYVELIDQVEELYVPEAWRKQSASNKQASDGVTSEPISYTLFQMLDEIYARGAEYYRAALQLGVAREMARLFLPGFSVYYTWEVSVNLLNLFKFLKLRLANDAQHEIREYAKALHGIIKPLAPWSVEAFEASIRQA